MSRSHLLDGITLIQTPATPSLAAYRPLARRAATLFLALGSLHAVDPMYRFGLAALCRLFDDALAGAAPQTPAPELLLAGGFDGNGDGAATAAAAAAAATAAAADAARERVEELSARLVRLVHAHVCRGLLNRHRLPAMLHLARALRPEAFPEDEWAFLVGRPTAAAAGAGTDAAAADATTASAAASGARSGHHMPPPAWLAEEHAASYAELCAALPRLAALAGLSDAAAWAPWAAAPPDADAPLPAAAAGRLLGLQELALVKALKPDGLQAAMSRFACCALGVPSVAPPAQGLAAIIDETAGSDNAAAAPPLLLVATPGADPCQELADAAAARGVRLREFALGEGGGGAAAAALLEASAREGGWLVLKNCHLAVEWLTDLEKQVHALGLGAGGAGGGGAAPTAAAAPAGSATEAGAAAGAAAVAGAATATAARCHPSFRLFLTAEPHPSFPPALLEACAKAAFEAPPGLKRNVARTLASWAPDWPQTGCGRGGASDGTSAAEAGAAAAGNGPLRVQLSFLAAWLHAVVQERRAYAPAAWAAPYDFSSADLRAGLGAAAHAAAAAAAAARGGGAGAAAAWRALRGLLGDCVYGGRIYGAHDDRVRSAETKGTATCSCVTCVSTPAVESRRMLLAGNHPTQRSTHHQQYTKSAAVICLQVLRAHIEAILSADVLPDASTGAGAGRPRRQLPGLSALLPGGAAALEARSWQALVEALPERDAPEAFGLPANVGRVAQRAGAGAALGALKRLELLRGSEGGGGHSGSTSDALDTAAAAPAASVARLAPLVRLWEQLLSGCPPGVRAAAASAAVGTGSLDRAAQQQPQDAGALGPVGSFVLLELEHSRALVAAASAVFAALRRTVASGGAGSAATGAPLAAGAREAGAALLQDAVPDAWRDAWPAGPDGAADFVRAALARASAIEAAWAPRFVDGARGGSGSGDSAAAAAAREAAALRGGPPLQLSQLFRPAALLGALRQAAARASGAAVAGRGAGGSLPAALDALRLVSAIDPALLPPAALAPAPVAGLLLQGAAFDGRRLAPVESAAAPLSRPLPALWVAWLPAAVAAEEAGTVSQLPRGGDCVVAVPLYASPDRASAPIAELQLPAVCAASSGAGVGSGGQTEAAAAAWALAGVAVVLGS